MSRGLWRVNAGAPAADGRKGKVGRSGTKKGAILTRERGIWGLVVTVTAVLVGCAGLAMAGLRGALKRIVGIYCGDLWRERPFRIDFFFCETSHS